MASDTKSFKFGGTDDEWNKFASGLRLDGRTVQQEVTSMIRQKLSLMERQEEEISKTTSAHQEDFEKYITENYNLKNALALGHIHVDLTEPQHQTFIDSCGFQLDQRIKDTVHTAIAEYWFKKIAHERTTDLELYKEKYGIDKNHPLTMEQAIQQQLYRLHQRNIGFTKAVDNIKVTWDAPITPVKKISKFTEDDINHVFQVDCVVIGPSQKKFNTVTGKYIQHVLVQEIEGEAEYSNPAIIKCVIHGNGTENIATGQRKKIIGKYMVEPPVKGKKVTDERSLAIDVFHVQDAEDNKPVILSKEEIEKTRKAAHDDEEKYIHDLLKSFCPKVYGRDLEKLALLLALLGGTRTDEGIRSETHLMLIGDPSTGKSEMAKYGNKIAPKSSIIDGANTTGVGILFAMDEYNGTKILKSGLMIQNSGGHLIIDEFDKMPKTEQKKVNNAMEQQQATYNKGGHIARAETKTAVITACNPVNERWNDSKEIIDNMPFDASTISRYDVIILLRENMNKLYQTNKMKHTMKYKKGLLTDIASVQFMKGLVNHMRDQKPRFSQQAEEFIVDKFVELQFIEQPEGALQIETRQMEGIQRLCEAYAKLTFRKEVDIQCVKTVLWFYQKCLATLGMSVDNQIHQVDMRSKQINREEFFEEEFNKLASENEQGNVVAYELGEKLIENTKFFKTDSAVMSFIEQKKTKGWLYEPKTGILRRQNK